MFIDTTAVGYCDDTVKDKDTTGIGTMGRVGGSEVETICIMKIPLAILSACSSIEMDMEEEMIEGSSEPSLLLELKRVEEIKYNTYQGGNVSTIGFLTIIEAKYHMYINP